MAFPACDSPCVATARSRGNSTRGDDMPLKRRPRARVRSSSSRTSASTPTATPRKQRAGRSSARRSSSRSRSESLRSTMLTNCSDSFDDEQFSDQALDNDADECYTLAVYGGGRPLCDWVYWQRDAVLLPQCWTRVFAVFSGALLWLYRYNDATAKSLLVRMRVTSFEVQGARQLALTDASTGIEVQLCLLDVPAFQRWQSYVQSALIQCPPVTEEEESSTRSRQRLELSTTSRSTTPAPGPIRPKKSFWTALSSLGSSSRRAENAAMVVFDNGRDRDRNRSLGQRWKTVATALKSVWKPGSRRRQL